jgi:hypothetical protein
MKNYSIQHTIINETVGMKAGFARPVSLVKVFDGNSLVKTFTKKASKKDEFSVAVSIFMSNNSLSDMHCSFYPKNVKSKWYWTSRNDENCELLILESVINQPSATKKI